MSTDPETAKDSDNAASHDAMKDIWDSVTEGTFDHLNIEIDVFFIVVFLVIVSRLLDWSRASRKMLRISIAKTLLAWRRDASSSASCTPPQWACWIAPRNSS